MGRFAKAIAPAVVTVLAVGIQWVASGAFDRVELATALTGLLAAAVAFWVPNEPTNSARRIRGRE